MGWLGSRAYCESSVCAASGRVTQDRTATAKINASGERFIVLFSKGGLAQDARQIDGNRLPVSKNYTAPDSGAGRATLACAVAKLLWTGPLGCARLRSEAYIP